MSSGYSPTGTITFTLYAPGDTTCSSAIQTYAVTVSGAAADSRNTDPANTGYAVTQAGTYRWKASYGGDSNNLGATSGCDDELVVVNKNSPSIATTPKVQIIMTDVATLSGFAGTPTGTFDFKLYENDATCAGTPLFTAIGVAYNGTITGATTTSGTLPSASTYYTSDKTFTWKVHYSGDTNNNAADSTCGETVVIDFQ